MNFVLLTLFLSLTGKSTAPPPPPSPPDPRVLRLGIWIESPPGGDSASARRWASRLTSRLDTLIAAPPARQRAVLDRVVFVAPGSLPLAGGDPHHHPDLRAVGLDLVWGIQVGDSLVETTARRILRTFLANRGCLDDRSLSVGWDMLRIPELASNHLDRALFPIDSRNTVHRTSWSLDTGSLTPGCLRALQAHPGGGGTTYSDPDRLALETSRQLSVPLEVRVRDALGHTAAGAVLEVWRGRPDSSRPYATRLEGPPDSLVADDSGIVALRTPLQWLADTASWVHGKRGSRGVSFWRLSHAHRQLWGWMDAGSLLSLPDSSDTLRLSWDMPAGSSRSWREAAQHWPRPWLAAEVDSSGIVTMGLSVPFAIEYVLRLVDDHGREVFRSSPLAFAPGLYEKKIDRAVRPGSWDVRLDAPSSRLQVRLVAP